MIRRHKRIQEFSLLAISVIWLIVSLPYKTIAAPYAAMVMDGRTGEVLSSENADTRLHPASLTKMMTLYVVFEAIENGEISPDKKVRISRKAASEPPSRLGLREGQRIRLRYLIRSAALKSANDAATALGEAIEGSEAAFARRMNRTAKALGMTRTTFKNAHGLTERGHMSTARDMTILGRHLFYDYPGYYHLFSRKTISIGSKSIPNTNRRFLRDYKGANGIKTGYTNAAGFNLVASATRGNEQIIATVFGGRSTKTRNAQVAKLLNLGFKKAPANVKVLLPRKPNYEEINRNRPVARIISHKTAVEKSLRPRARPILRTKNNAAGSLNIKSSVTNALTLANLAVSIEQTNEILPAKVEGQKLTKKSEINKLVGREIVTRLSASSERDWAINVGRFTSRYAAEQMLIKTALSEMSTLNGSLRKVVKKDARFEANFMGLSKEAANRACRRLTARNVTCSALGPS